MTPIILGYILTTQSPKVTECKRCGHNVKTEWKEAITIASKKLNVPTEKSAMEGLILREHGWATPSRHLQNRRSSAYGLGQFLNGTWKSVGMTKTSCSVCQVEGIYRYCRSRYGSVNKALSAWRSRSRNGRSGGWY